MLEVIPDLLLYVVAPLVVLLLGSGLWSLVVELRAAPDKVERRTRGMTDINSDLRRWVRDRDRRLRERFSQLSVQNVQAGTYFGGALVQGRAKAQHEALHEYRDEALRKLRAFDEVTDGESWVEKRVRQRKNAPPLRVALPTDCRELLGEWRAPARHPTKADLPSEEVEDPTSGDLRVADIESGPEPPA